GSVIGIAKLALEEPIDAAQLLLFPELNAVAREPRVFLAMLPGRIVAALDRALVGKTFVAFEEKLLALTAALTAFCVKISRHRRFSLDSTPLRRTASVMRDGRDVGD